MKRRLTALILTVVMVLCAIPSTLLPVVAHGLGVAVNNIDNTSINNAPNQAIPSTVWIDGIENDSAWDHDNWQIATAGTGIWDAVYYRSSNFAFKYQMATDYEYLYGIVELDTNEIYNGNLGDITIWLNTDPTVEKYTAKIVLDVTITDGVASVVSTRLDNAGNVLSDPAETLDIDKYLDEAVLGDDGILTVEFRTLTATVAGKAAADMTAYVSVGIDYSDVTQTLYHPRFDAEVDDNDLDPTKSWPKNATVITSREIYALPNADYSKVLPNEMVIDGKINEAVWAPYTTKFTAGMDNFEYRNDAEFKDDATGQKVMDFGTVKYHDELVSKFNNSIPGATSGTDVGIKYKYDIRCDANNLYGAVIAYADINTIKNVYGTTNYSSFPVVLSMSWAKYNPNGTIKNGSPQRLYIYNFTELNGDDATQKGDSFTGDCVITSISDSYTAKDIEVKGGSKRTSDYLVEFEFSIPLSDLYFWDGSTGFQDGYEYYYILSVNTSPWQTNGEHTNDISGESKCASEVSTLSSLWDACKSKGNYFVKTTGVNTENWTANGNLDEGRWSAIKAADNKIDCMVKNPSYTNALTTEHMAYKLFTDDDSLYGLAVIEDTNWALVNDAATNLGTASAFNIWMNNGVTRWGDWYDNKLTFQLSNSGETYVRLTNHYVESTSFYNGTENILTGVYKAGGLAAVKQRGFSSGTITAGTFKSGDYATKWLMHPTESAYTQGVEAVMQKIGTNKYLLEFKVPLEMLLVTESTEKGYQDIAFSYVATVGNGNGSNKELCHPMWSNRKLNQSGAKVNSAALSEKTFYVQFWNAHEVNNVYSSNLYTGKDTDIDYTNNVGDGKLHEYYWDTVDEMIKVNGETGLWANPPVGYDYTDYYYRVYTSREWLYGGAVIEDAANANDTKFTFWFKTDYTPVYKYKDDGVTIDTDSAGNPIITSYTPNTEGSSTRLEIYLNEAMEPVADFYKADNTLLKRYTGVSKVGDVEKGAVQFTDTILRYTMGAANPVPVTANYGYASMKTINGETYVEFKINYDKFITDHSNHTKFVFNETANSENGAMYSTYETEHNIGDYYIESRGRFEYCVSVTHEDNTLFHLGGNEYNLWVNEVNGNLLNKGGNIITDKTIMQGINGSAFDSTNIAGGYVLLVPTELDDVYEVQLMNYLDGTTWDEYCDATNTATWGDVWTNAIQNLPEGAFIYKVRSSSTMPQHMDWSWSAPHSGAIFDVLFQAGKYVEFTNFNPYGTTVEEVAPALGNTDVTIDYRGYFTAATFNSFEYPDNINKVQNGVTEYPNVAWTFATDYVIYPLKNFVPEKVEVDGYLDDSGWDDGKWISVSNDINGNTQNPGQNTTPEFEYKYQIRTDGEYVYVAALMDHEPDYTTATNGWMSSPQFRIWIQSEGDEYSDAISFTHLFDVRLGSDTDPNATQKFGTWQSGNVQTTVTVDKYSYKNDNLSFNPLADSNTHVGVGDVVVTESGDKVKVTYDDVTLRFAEHRSYPSGEGFWDRPNGGNVQTWIDPLTGKAQTTTRDQTNGFGLDSVFWGEKKAIYENTVDAKYATTDKNGNPIREGAPSYTYSWFAQPTVSKYTYGDEHAAYNTTNDGTQTVVEFKFALSDIGTDADKGFKYYVQCSAVGSTTSNAYVLFHPNYTIEPDAGLNTYHQYHLPFWVWGGNAIVCDKDWFYDNDLNNPKVPVTTLGCQYAENYNVNATTKFDSVLRFGVLYTEEYLDNVYGRTDWAQVNGNTYTDGYGEFTWNGPANIYEDATYWDVKDIGMLIRPSKSLAIVDDNDINLTTDTPKVQHIVADNILRHSVQNSNMADYENFIFYSIMNVSGRESTKVTFRGVTEYLRYGDTYYGNTDVPTSVQDENYWMRPSYYSHCLTRSFDMVKAGHEKFGNYLPVEKDYIEPDDKVNIGGSETKLTVAYIPLDDRPVNDQRVQYLAQAAGINLLMPDENYYKNTLDNDENWLSDGKQSDSGNPKQLLEWLKRMEEEENVNYYILSLDMLFSGGLIGSRAPEVDDDYDDDSDGDDYTIGSIVNGEYELSEGEDEILQYLVQLANDNTNYVVYFDTIIRLASTTYYGNYSYNDYQALRHGYADKPRPQLYGEDLTIDNIVAGYDTLLNTDTVKVTQEVTGSGANETVTYHVTGGKDPGSYYIFTSKVEQYKANRQRKLTIIDKLLTTKGENGKPTIDNIDSLILGVDDSMPQTTIQTNELRYIEDKLVAGRDNTVVMAAADELGLLGISDIATKIYGKVKVNLQYFGTGKDQPADDFDRGSLNEATKLHVKAAGGYFDYQTDGGMDILVLTRCDDTTASIVAAAKELLVKAKDNLAKGIPTCIVDGANKDGILASLMVGQNYKDLSSSLFSTNYKLDNIGLLMGYSEWNTTANSLGIAISNAITRYTYLQHAKEVSTESNYGFMKVITHAFVKDIAYREGSDGATFYEKAPYITDMINDSLVYVGEIGVVEPTTFTEVKVSDLYWPWDRSFEADFVISFSDPDTGNVAIYGNDAEAPFKPSVIYQVKSSNSGRHAALNDGVASPTLGNYKASGVNDMWYEILSANGEKAVKFDLGQYSDLAYLRVHLYGIDGIEYDDGALGSPSRITVYASNYSDSGWVEIGTIKPNQTANGDFYQPDGNTNPGKYTPFFPEITGKVSYSVHVPSMNKNSTYYQECYDKYSKIMDADEKVYVPTYSYWATVPVETLGNKYQFVKIVFNSGNICDSGTWLNEIEIYEGDENYLPEYILPCEKANFSTVDFGD